MPRANAIGIALVCVFAVAGAGALSSISKRYGLAHEVQKHFSCLPYSLYWVDYQPGEIERGDLVQVEAPHSEERFKQGIPLMKIVVGIPGDTMMVRNDVVYVNGEFWARLFMRKTLGKPAGYFDRSITIGEGEYAVMGVTPSSYDSRYWGTITKDAIHGTATVLL